MSMRLSSLLALATLAGFASRAAGHEFWIEPSSFQPKSGSDVRVSLKVGQRLVGESVPRKADRIARFFAVGPAGEVEVGGDDGGEPAGTLRVERSGLMILGFRSNRASIELPAEQFETYLEEEGLGHIRELRRHKQQSGALVREVYSRCAKSLIAVDGNADGDAGRPLGFTLEIIPEGNPCRLRPGAKLGVRLLFRGRPLADAAVIAICAGHTAAPQRVRTGADGRAEFTLATPGLWMIHSVHMIEAPPDAGADWESFWGTLTFELAGAGKP
ncbi:MAG: DUF4198 domain-containing protein [Phycisphaerae bacterium]|jgi:uncharacterized GH25 family protein